MSIGSPTRDDVLEWAEQVRAVIEEAMNFQRLLDDLLEHGHLEIEQYEHARQVVLALALRDLGFPEWTDA